MKSRRTFHTLILFALAPVLVVLTAAWAWQVYHATHRIILQGFDRKLLAVAGSTAALVDGDAHERYQPPRRIVALAGDAAGLTGWAAETGPVAINAATGGARPLGAPDPSPVRGLAATSAGDRIFALRADGRSLVEMAPASGEVVRTLPLSAAIDGVFLDANGLAGWRGTRGLRLDVASGAVTPAAFNWPEPLRSVACDPAAGRIFGLSVEGGALLVLDEKGGPVRRLPLVAAAHPAGGATATARPAPPIAALAWSHGRLYAAGPSLLQLDPASGQVSAGEFTTGYFDVAHPFYRALRGAFIQLQRDAGLTYLYSQVYTGERKLHYVMDGTTGGDYSRPGTDDDVPEAMIDAAERVQFLGQTHVTGIQQWEPWGLVKSGYAPIRNAAGHVVAMAGADVEISVIRAKSRAALFASIVIGVGSLVAAGLVSFRVARTLTRPLQELKESALWIAAGHYGVALTAGGTREVSALARRLDALRLRLAGEGDRVYRWQDEIRGLRAGTALAHTLTEDPTGAGGRSVEALTTHHHGADFVTWLATPEADPMTAACAHARAGLLARELLRAGHPAAEMPERLLLTAQDLTACAAWQESAGCLYYRTRSPVSVQIDGAGQVLQGAGALALHRRPAIRWNVAPGATKGAT